MVEQAGSAGILPALQRSGCASSADCKRTTSKQRSRQQRSDSSSFEQRTQWKGLDEGREAQNGNALASAADEALREVQAQSVRAVAVKSQRGSANAQNKTLSGPAPNAYSLLVVWRESGGVAGTRVDSPFLAPAGNFGAKVCRARRMYPGHVKQLPNLRFCGGEVC
jgi:hypothetical protein